MPQVLGYAANVAHELGARAMMPAHYIPVVRVLIKQHGIEEEMPNGDVNSWAMSKVSAPGTSVWWSSMPVTLRRSRVHRR